MPQETCSVEAGSKKCCPFDCCTPEVWSILILRLFLGLRMLTAGIGKFLGATGFSFANHHEKFVIKQVSVFSTETFLPVFMLKPYLHLLPYFEILLGIMLLLGIRTKCALGLTGLLFVSIGFGMMMLPPGQGSQTVTGIGIYLLLTIVALMLVKHDKLQICKCS